MQRTALRAAADAERQPDSSMPRPVLFSSTAPRGDRIYHLKEEDIRVLLGRLPEDARRRLRRVHFNDRS